ncbi:uncharacterized protein HMPREF1120_07898 [Exophiala dermatitidis NIH/UT8656]|uniref:Uncharacterized protein n=2 Tax=Exophiala dermatitidis TaxID=5970 RepID=H6C9R8_EXODN|nr:uncharacterized protein HMPREF1120_07898 [Exophiala dermatitidis NIH/UT8656]EHY59921.1 hypothetical protein HMPREF1120_07898 [Exophiala dermatitidis NIH/UT8656]
MGKRARSSSAGSSPRRRPAGPPAGSWSLVPPPPPATAAPSSSGTTSVPGQPVAGPAGPVGPSVGPGPGPSFGPVGGPSAGVGFGAGPSVGPAVAATYTGGGIVGPPLLAPGPGYGVRPGLAPGPGFFGPGVGVGPGVGPGPGFVAPGVGFAPASSFGGPSIGAAATAPGGVSGPIFGPPVAPVPLPRVGGFAPIRPLSASWPASLPTFHPRPDFYTRTQPVAFSIADVYRHMESLMANPGRMYVTVQLYAFVRPGSVVPPVVPGGTSSSPAAQAAATGGATGAAASSVAPGGITQSSQAPTTGPAPGSIEFTDLHGNPEVLAAVVPVSYRQRGELRQDMGMVRAILRITLRPSGNRGPATSLPPPTIDDLLSRFLTEVIMVNGATWQSVNRREREVVAHLTNSVTATAAAASAAPAATAPAASSSSASSSAAAGSRGGRGRGGSQRAAGSGSGRGRGRGRGRARGGRGASAGQGNTTPPPPANPADP